MASTLSPPLLPRSAWVAWSPPHVMKPAWHCWARTSEPSLRRRCQTSPPTPPCSVGAASKPCERRGAVHAEAAYLRGGGGRARGEAGRRRRVRDPALGAHRKEPESPPSPAPPRGPACVRARAPRSLPSPGPCNLHAARAAPPSVPERPQLRGLSPLPPPYAGSRAAVGSRTFRKAPRVPWVKGQVASFPGGGLVLSPRRPAWKSLESAPLFFRLRPPASAALRGALATNRRARRRGRPLSRSGG